MAGRFTPRRGLDQRVAELVAPKIGEIAERVEVAARGFAPPEKTWVSRGDALVRKEHRKAHGQAVPENLRFVVDSPLYDRQHYGVGAQQLLRVPGDPDGSPGAVINCRCGIEVDPQGVARTINAGRPVVSGSRVTATVTCSHGRAAESEFGTAEDEPARFMGQAVSVVAAELR